MKERILQEAVELINRVGYQDFSMRMLARELKVTPPTLYSYFKNKDELHLCILTEGFIRLYDILRRAYESEEKSIDRMRAIGRAFFNFGIANANFYNLMFSRNVPRYHDYIGTAMEPVARVEFESFRRTVDLTVSAIRECAGEGHTLSEEDATFLLIHVYSALHGFISSMITNSLDYVHENPVLLRDRHLDLVNAILMREVKSLSVAEKGREKGSKE
ncbi:MAG TPA: TetR/AcrR family transcriptional regulator [Deltaproteobacteria bacterium]|nr:TetR/AcrR family transcriptional regulator [Deltaproteobacteria bacterium]HXK47415.1 TetR/AcrR family transcriptional regulator [Deltaproteobacteria bacterium]